MKTGNSLFFAAALFMLLVSDRTHACPSFNFSDYLTAIRGGVIVSYEGERYIFDDHGNFQHELSIPVWDDIFGMSGDGSLWARVYSDTAQTIISNYTITGAPIKEYQLNGQWNAVLRNNVIYVARNVSNELEIEILDPKSATTSKYLTLTTPVVSYDWAIGENAFVCAIGLSGNLTTLYCFDSQRNVQWSQEYQSTEVFSLTIDSKNNVYVVGVFRENSEPAVLQFDSDGTLKGEIRSGSQIFAFDLSENGSLFVGDPDKVVTRLDQHGKFQESWDASYLAEGETWIERRHKEHASQYVTEFSRTEDLIATALHGNFNQRQVATKALIASGPQVVPLVFEQCMLSKGFSEELLSRIKDEFPEESISEMARRFQHTDEFERASVLPELIEAGRSDVPGLVELVEEMSHSTEEYEPELAHIYLVQIGRGSDVLHQYWERYHNGEEPLEDSAYMFSQDLSEAIKILEPALLNPQDPAHESAKENLLEAIRLISFEEKSNVLNEESIRKIGSWTDSGIPDIQPLTSVLLLRAGNLNELKRSIQFAERDSKLSEAVVRLAVDVIANSTVIEQEVGSRVYDLGIKIIFKEGAYEEDYYNVLLCKKLMYFEGFRNLAMSVALKSILSDESAKLEELIISKYLGPELISSSVVFEFLANGTRSHYRYWEYLNLIAKRFESDHSIRRQIRSLIFPHLTSESPHLFQALTLIGEVGESQDFKVIQDLLTNCPNWVVEQVNKILAVLDVDRAREDELISKLKTSTLRNRQEIFVLLAEMRSTEGFQFVKKELDESIVDGEFPPSGVVAASMIYGEDPWLLFLEELSPHFETCNTSMLKSFPETMKLKASKRIGELMLQENDRKRFDLLDCWLNREAFESEAGFISELVRLKHPNPKMRKNVTDYF